jgi:hypothetical protein
MAQNEIDIEVNVDANKALKNMEKLEAAGEAVGESFNSLGGAVGAMGGVLNENLGALGESMGGLTEALVGVGQAARGSGMSFTALAGPIGMIGVALVEAYQAYRDFVGVNRDAEINTKAYEIATGELTTAIEELATAQVKLNRAQIQELMTLSMSAKIPIERAQMLREDNADRVRRLDIIDREIAQIHRQNREMTAMERAQRSLYSSGLTERRLNDLTRERIALKEELNRKEMESIDLMIEGSELFAKFEARKLELEKQSAEYKEEVAKKEQALLDDAAVKNLARSKHTLETQNRLALMETEKRIREINAMEDISNEVRAKAVIAEQKALLARFDELRKADAEKQVARAKQAQAMRSAAALRRLALERKTQSELDRIRRAEIEQLRLQGASQLDVLEMNQELALKAVQKNERLKTAVMLEFENKRTKIMQEQERKRAEEAKRAAEKERQEAERRRAFEFNSAEFDAQRIKDGLERELALLDLKYRKELEMAERSQSEITELSRRYAIEREEITEATTKAQIEAAAQLTSIVSDGLAESAYHAVLLGESFTESISKILIGLGKEASVRSLMELASGVAALYYNPALAAGHFKAAGFYATAAAVVGTGGLALGGGGGGGGDSVSAKKSASASPSGSPQSAPKPQRERAESQALVFNINFGNSTIYDTKRAAQDAMASEIMRTMQRQRRGAPRFMGV